MSQSVLLWTVLAVLLFWSMGAYNRLVRLRAQCLLSFAALQRPLSEQILLVTHNFQQANENEPMDGQSSVDASFLLAWANLSAAAEQFSAALRSTQARPLDGASMGALNTAYKTMQEAWGRLTSLPSDLAGPALPQSMQSQWDQKAAQTELARVDFNARIDQYNQGIGQFPALLLAWVFGFQSAHPLERVV